jgi:uncharacterized membrane protein (UPF0127 family)
MSWPPRKNLWILGVIGVFGLWWWLKPVTFETETLYIQSDKRLWPMTVEIAKTSAQRNHGLKSHSHLAANTGMLFIFPDERVVSMQTQNIRFRVDMMFVNKRGHIAYIIRNAVPRSTKQLTSGTPALAVLEIPGGLAKVWQIKVGDTIIHPAFNPYSTLP